MKRSRPPSAEATPTDSATDEESELPSIPLEKDGFRPDPLSAWSMLAALARKRPRHVWISEWRAAEGPSPPLSSVLSIYDSEGYGCMTHNTARNARYALAIKRAAAVRNRGSTWLEVGPGKDALLTLMALKASDEASTRSQNHKRPRIDNSMITPDALVKGTSAGTKKKRSSEPMHVVAVEGNPSSMESAKSTVRAAGYSPQCTIIAGLTTSPPVEKQLGGWKFDVLMHEVLGFFAGSEGVCAVIAALRKSTDIDTAIMIPRRAATFITPINLLEKHIQVASAVYVAPPTFASLARFPISEAERSTGGSGPKWHAKSFEYIDFARSMDVQQKKKLAFVSDSAAVVSAFATWLWCETAEDGAYRRLETTAFPYGDYSLVSCHKSCNKSCDKVCSDGSAAMSPGRDAVEFSSRVDDGGAYSSSWRNVILLLPNSLHLKPGDALTVGSECDLRTVTPSYRFIVSVNGVQCADLAINNCTPTFVAPS